MPGAETSSLRRPFGRHGGGFPVLRRVLWLAFLFAVGLSQGLSSHHPAYAMSQAASQSHHAMHEEHRAPAALPGSHDKTIDHKKAVAACPMISCSPIWPAETGIPHPQAERGRRYPPETAALAGKMPAADPRPPQPLQS
ncbi:hypothetical protein [Mesorhizobium sp. RMAD-H1]|uniref:hypothetical protein n=1 Tax=Mesorhizobium sp. RMAD-H1 TaxID=2587065 RepID=UPI00161795D9|nr:hypothetical protein [Mesorhizobium sp. RMAD-H1]MBB2969906.1 hypothetical protein [Mesorhizobium sp. RMAD-H1]